ncbi:transposase [Streptomyces sp. NPDC020801]|uniref:transposase n=1 Tax=unclassified Streptomyces TaxID=2593676 RepID=UPI00379B31DA
MRRSYDAPFREGAVRIVLETGKSAAEVARDPDVHEGTGRRHSAAGGLPPVGSGPGGSKCGSQPPSYSRKRSDRRRARGGCGSLGSPRVPGTPAGGTAVWRHCGPRGRPGFRRG